MQYLPELLVASSRYLMDSDDVKHVFIKYYHCPVMKKSRVVNCVLEILDDVTMRRAATRLLSFCFRLVNFSGLNFKSWFLHTFGLVCNQKDSGLKKGNDIGHLSIYFNMVTEITENVSSLIRDG